jgi:predicted metalloprotease with PDZ domain
MPTTTRYRIAPLDVHAHLFEVRCTVDDPAPDGQRFRLPVWIPGSYLVREFARHFVEVRAEAGGRPVAIGKEAKDTWRAARCAGPLTVVAHVYAFDLSVRGAYLDATRGYFNGALVFLCPEGRTSAPCEVEIVAPSPARQPPWRIATTLPRAGATEGGFGTYRARDYDELIDHPVEMAPFALVSFEAGGVRHDVAVTGRIDADLDRIARDLARVCQWQIDLFAGAEGGRAPFDRYLFQVVATGEGYGGLEHRSSTSLLCRRNELPVPGAQHVTDGYRNFLGLASHEYFHAWNVKRIKPVAFTPYDLAHENYTRQLWAFEGITSYYDDLALLRSSVIEPSSYLELLGRAITTVLRTPGRHRQSLSESSFDAWIKYYRADENTPNAVISYYAKGSLVALALDLTLRRAGSSLDALMRALWQRYGATDVGVPEDAIAKLAGELAGRGLGDFFDRYVHGTEDPPLSDLLAGFGVALHVRAAAGDDDRGGRPGKAHGTPGGPARCWLGAKIAVAAEPKVHHVYRGGPAERAGLAGGDILIAIDGLRASAESVRRLLERHRPRETLTVHAFRRDELIVTQLTLESAPLDTCWLTMPATIDADVRARRDAWLGRPESGAG